MNAIRQTQLLNKRELENATPPSASWHADYRDTAWIYVGGLHLDLTEGDVVIIFSQYGNPTHLNLIRDKETGKSKGFAFLKYEDQRSCDLAVDNLGGAEVLGRVLRVDHTRYKKKDDEDEDTYRIERLEALLEAEEGVNGNGKRGSDDDDTDDQDDDDQGAHRRKRRRHRLKEEEELERMLAIKQDGEEEDPMREYLIREKRDEVERAKERRKERRKHRHRRQEDDLHEGKDDTDKEAEHRRRHRHRDSEDPGRRKDWDGSEHTRTHRREDGDDKKAQERYKDRDSRYDRDRDRDREGEHRHRHHRRSRERRPSRDADRPSHRRDDYD